MTVKKRMQVMMMLGLVLVGIAVYLLGWLSAPRSWQEATGWQTIDPAWRPQPSSATIVDGPEIYWLGHSSMLVKWDDATILLDPNVNHRCTVSHRVLEPSIPVETLGHIDAVLISHAHYDHLDLPTLQSISPIDHLVVPDGSQVYVSGERLADRIVPLGVGDVFEMGDIHVTAVPAAHNGNRKHPFRSRYPAVGYIIEKGDVALYYAGDTARHNDFDMIRNEYRPDIAILPIGAYAPRFPLGWHHLAPEEAAEVARELNVSLTIPCHFGTFTLSLDRPYQALPLFARAAHREAISWQMAPFLSRGSTWPLETQVAGQVSHRGSVD